MTWTGLIWNSSGFIWNSLGLIRNWMGLNGLIGTKWTERDWWSGWICDWLILFGTDQGWFGTEWGLIEVDSGLEIRGKCLSLIFYLFALTVEMIFNRVWETWILIKSGCKYFLWWVIGPDESWWVPMSSSESQINHDESRWVPNQPAQPRRWVPMSCNKFWWVLDEPR